MSGPTPGQTGSPAGVFGPALRWPPGSDKFRLLASILLTASAAYGLAYLAISLSRGWPAGFGDSFALWSWARFIAEHHAAAIYDPAALRPFQLSLGMDPGGSYPFGYPPSFLLVLWPLGHLPGWLAGTALIALSMLFYLWATLGPRWQPAALVAALALPTTAIAVVSGQSGMLAAALLAGGLRLAAGNPIAAGILLGLLSFKAQFGLLLPVALLTAGLWRTIAAATLTALALAAVTSLLFGIDVWPAWFAGLPAFSRQFAAESSEIVHLMPTVLAALQRLGVAPALAQAAQWAAAVLVAGAVWFLFRRGPGPLAGAGLCVAVFLATPYAFVYDMPVIATAVIWLVAERQRDGGAFGTAELLVMIAALLSPVVLVAGTSRFPLAPLALALLLGAIVARERRQRRMIAPGS